jgi:hypothetical protein
VGNEINFAKPWALLVPIGKCSDGDVMFEQGTGSSEGTAPELTLALGLGQKSVSGCRTHMQQLFTQTEVGEGEYPLLFHQRENLPDECGEAFAAQAIGEGPELLQSVQEGLCSVEPYAMPFAARSTGVAGDKDHPLTRHYADLLFATISQNKSSIGSSVSREPNKVRENLTAFLLARLLKTGAQLPDDGMAFMHGKPHGM